MWPLDANMDVHLVESLRSLGVETETAGRHGWGNLSNGDLVAAAVNAGFTCVLTRDHLFGESAACALKLFPGFSVVVVNLMQRQSGEYLRQFIAAWNESPINPVAGQLIHWPRQ